MPLYKYTAKDFSLNTATGEINASSEREARAILRKQELFVISIKEIDIKETSGRGSGLNIEIIKKKVKLEELTLFSRQFATLVSAGVPISRSLHILSDNTTNRTFKMALIDVTKDIESGLPLSEALGKHDKIFPLMYINMIAAAEMGGALPEVLNRLANYLEKDKSLKGKIKSAFTYPIIVGIVAIMAIVVLLTFVIPKFIPLFDGLGEELPLPTKILLLSSEIFINYWYIFGGVFVLGIISLIIYSKTKIGKIHTDWLKINIPIVGDVVKKSSIARFSRTLETLQRSGVPLVESLSIVGRSSGNHFIQKAIEQSLDALERGEGISGPLSQSNVFPALVTQMIEIGEETGELEAMLSKIAEFYEEEVDIAIDNLTAMIEPAITVFLGVVVGFIALSVIMPMYGMMGSMQEQM